MHGPNEEMSARHDGSAVATVEAPPKPKTTKRRKPKTARERLAEVMRQQESLKQQVEAQRERECVEIVEALYELHGIEAISGDVGEGQRLARLRDALGLASTE
ncbi:hypothetical protein [Brevibacterium zhoupengii]|uniref:hypothetical protein n=1 Tax=Brevibacterium zhoupengii TaxID=2898795 RepID=UPI001E46ED81|nr:hypothetical protein [Brevibacterium zhoupengii]